MEYTKECMRKVYKAAPLLAKINNTYSHITLAEYLQLIKENYIKKNNSGLDSDIESAIQDYAENLVGSKDTAECIRVLKMTGLLYTANHHVINFHPMSVQGNLLYEYLISLCTDTDVVPTFSCSTIPMTNAFYPRGMIVCDTAIGRECNIPVFPHKMKRVSISHAPVFTSEMLSRTADTIRRYRISRRICAETADTLQSILENVYAEVAKKNSKRYGEQIILANSILSSGYRTDKSCRHIFLELEEVAWRVLCRDLAKEGSMLNRLLWVPERLNALAHFLEGVSGCWSGLKGGTFLFWGIDKKNRAFRLSNESGQKSPGSLVLTGRDFDGEMHTFNLDRFTLSEALKERRLLPGNFLSFFSLGIARKSCLVGGCFQGEYLKQMINGVRRAFKDVPFVPGEEKFLPLYLPDQDRFPYLCGPLFLTGANESSYYPLSSVELWRRPLSFEELKKGLNIPFVKAQQVGLYCFYPILVPKDLRDDDWWNRISKELLANI